MPAISTRLALPAILFSILFAASSSLIAQELVSQVESRRLPAALVLSHDGNWAFVANEATGTLCAVSTQEPHAVKEFRIGQSIADVVVLGETNFLAAVDPLEHKVHLLEFVDHSIRTVFSQSVAHTPIQLAFDPVHGRLAVASLWSRRLTMFQWASDTHELQETYVQDLDIAPRQMQFIHSGEKLIVADNFSGRILGLSSSDGAMLRDRVVPAHKIRGFAITPDGERLVMSHQMLNSLAHAIRNDVHWGLMMSNDLRWLDLDVLLSDEEDFYHRSHMHPLGQPGAGMADPAGLAMSSQGDVAVAIEGVDRVLVGKESDFSLDAIAVGPGPIDVAFSPDGTKLYVAHRWDDSLSIVDVAERDPVVRIALGNVPDESVVEKGRRLFHQGRLAHDGWMSCSSCHVDGHTNGLLNDNFSDGSFGAPKRVLTLLGVAGTEPLAWNGAKVSLEEQIEASINATMQAPEAPTAAEVEAIAAFVRSLEVPPSLAEAREQSSPLEAARGRAVFEARGCADCHAGDRLTSPQTYDVGLVDEQGNRKFNPPSLQGLSQRAPYFHNGSAASLEAVLDESKHQLTVELTAEERADLLAYLRSL